MKTLPLILSLSLLTLPAFAQGKVLIAGSSSKELKRSAHRLHIPVEQLKNARTTLQEATDLVKRIEPYPYDQLTSLVQKWANLHKSRAKATMDSLVQELRSHALNASDYNTYGRATSAALSLLQTGDVYESEKVLELIRGWPKPKESFGLANSNLIDVIESQYRTRHLFEVSRSDPEKVVSLLSEAENADVLRSPVPAMLARELMNRGKQEEARSVLDQAISQFSQNPSDPNAITAFGSFISLTRGIDPERTNSAVYEYVRMIMNQPEQTGCSGVMTCAESRVFSFLQGLRMPPGVTSKAIDMVPGLRAKIESLGGIDTLYEEPGAVALRKPEGTEPAAENPSALFNRLKGKTETNRSHVRRELQKAFDEPGKLQSLISFATMTAQQDPELAALALEIGRELLKKFESDQQRALMMPRFMNAMRQVEGEVDQDLLLEGFILANDLREAKAESIEVQEPANEAGAFRTTAADKLELALIQELARDQFEKALQYVRSSKTDSFKLSGYLQIAEALSRSNY